MPASPATPRRSSKNRRSAPVTPARREEASSLPLGPSDSNSVRDRIRQWQEQGAKVGASPVHSDLLVPGDENADSGPPLPTSLAEKEVTRGAETTPRKKSGRWVNPAKKEWVREARSKSTPRKRVISDEHWKKQKRKQSPRSGLPDSEQIAHQQKQSPRPGPPSPEQETPYQKPSSDGTKHASSRIEKEEIRRRRKIARSGPESRSVHGDDTAVDLDSSSTYAGKHPTNEELTCHSDLESGVDDDLLLRFDGRDPPSQCVKEVRKSLGNHPQTVKTPVRQSQNAMLRDRSQKVEDGSGVPGSIRSRKSGFINQAKDMFLRTEPMPPTSQRLPSIEAWLNEQPDPFVDGNPDPVEIPAPLKTRSSKQKVHISPKALEDPNKIWNCVESEDHKPEQVTSVRRQRRRRSRRSQESADAASPESVEAPRVVEKTPKLSPKSQSRDQVPKEMPSNGLKRRGARALRTRAGSSPVKQTSSDHDSSPSERLVNPASKVRIEVPSRREEHSRTLRPCPPTGIHQLSTIASVETFQSQTQVGSGGDMRARHGNGNGLQRRLTTHEDLMSVLSLPRGGGSIRSGRSIRTMRRPISKATLVEVFEELEVDEAKYMRELKTLVDGVIPVLLQCVLSKSDSACAAGLFSSSGNARDDLNFTKPIVAMGVALERLKALHKRIPTQNLGSLLSWAQGANRVYNEYLNAWRLGFQDIIVNLAPPDDQTQTDLDEGMARDENGDVINGNGEKVDVAYLLKRPLVRIKKLAKVFARLKTLKPGSKASTVADQYDALITTARRRSHEEQSRLEDEAAANIDATKTRDIRTLAVLSGATIDRKRTVKARDIFSLTLHHSSGQRLDCQTELLLRADPAGLTSGGDLLICEVEDNGKWLLFPPLNIRLVSARFGDNDGEVVVMIRGLANFGRQWHELLLFTTDDVETASEWVTMLGAQPEPPPLNRSSSFITRQNAATPSLRQDLAAVEKELPLIPQSPSLAEVEIPIGESVVGVDEQARPRTAPGGSQNEQLSLSQPDFEARERPLPRQSISTNTKALPVLPSTSCEDEQPASPQAPLSDTSSPGLRRAKVARRRRTRRVESPPSSPLVVGSPTLSDHNAPKTGTRKLSRTDEASREWMTSLAAQRSASPNRQNSVIRDTSEGGLDFNSMAQRPRYHRAISSTPTADLPSIPRLRPSSPGGMRLTPSSPEAQSVLSHQDNDSKQGQRTTKTRPVEDDASHRLSHPGAPFSDNIPTPPPHRSRSPRTSSPRSPETGPTPPQHCSPPQQERAKAVPILIPQPVSPHRGRRNDRRSSSPLKHEYAPSSSSGSDEASIASSSSDSSDDGGVDDADDVDKPKPLLAAQVAHIPKGTAIFPAPASLPDIPAGTLAPSNSASQAPYRSVPGVALQAEPAVRKAIATLFSWSDKGHWDKLCPDECSIVVSPGLVEAYEMSAAHSGATPNNDNATTLDEDIRPLVAFELTPIVLIRRGTALDISIRSCPTANSKVRKTGNVMFRSRSSDECMALYNFIHNARLNNPTWIALEKARPRPAPAVTFNTEPGSARHSRSGSRSRSRSGSWFGISSHSKRSSYRASSAPQSGTPSLAERSETSVGSMSSAISALRRFSGGANGGGKAMFNLNRSSVMRKHGRFGTSGSASLYSSSNGTTRTRSGATSPEPSQSGLAALFRDHSPASGPTCSPGGTINNLKVRLYLRGESAVNAKWGNMGPGRMAVMPAPILIHGNANGPGTTTTTNMQTDDETSSPPGTTTGSSSRPTSTLIMAGQPGGVAGRGPRLPSSSHTPHRIHGDGNEKRILITRKSNGEVMLDATLRESCFERIARTGIAVNVWEEHDEVAKSGGVVGGKARTYMIQMMSEAEAAWVFGLVGRLRY
jgi:hypothetical protein